MPSYTTEGHSGIVSVDEMRRYLNNTYPESPAKQANIAAVLAGTQNQLEIFLNRPVEPVQIRELVRTDVMGRAFLTVSPVHSIASIAAVGSTFSPLGYSTPYIPPVFVRGTTYRSVDALPSLGGYPITPGGISVGTCNMWVTVDYIGGYFGYTDQAMKLAIMRVAAREIIPQHSDTINVQTGDIAQVNRSDGRTPGWTEDELNQFRRNRRTVMVNAGGYDSVYSNWLT